MSLLPYNAAVSINILILFGNYNKEAGNEQVCQEHLIPKFTTSEDSLEKFKTS